MTFYQRMRFRYGLRWNSKYPNLIKETLIFCVLLGVYGLVAHIDNLGDRVAEMEGESAYAQVLRDCMAAEENKEIGGFYFKDANLAYECKVNKL